MTKLTEHFTLEEMVKSEAALRKGIDNTPPQEVADNLKRLCENILQPVREHYGKGVKVNSGYRSSEVNIAIGGAAKSDHMTGNAADIEIPGVPNHELASYIAANYPFTQVILEFYTLGIPDSGWVHVAYNPADLKKQMLTAVKRDGKTVYLPGLVA